MVVSLANPTSLLRSVVCICFCGGASLVRAAIARVRIVGVGITICHRQACIRAERFANLLRANMTVGCIMLTRDTKHAWLIWFARQRLVVVVVGCFERDLLAHLQQEHIM